MSALTTPSSPETPETSVQGPRGYQYRWMVLAVAIVADVMDLLDAHDRQRRRRRRSAPTSAAPTPTLQWLAAGVHAGVRRRPDHPAGGSVTCFGRKPVFLIGMAGFTARLAAVRARADRRRR